jgi:predicted permease
MMSQLWIDLRYATRALARSPGFACAGVLTIALGIGINTAIFSVLNGIALRDLPATEADELVSIHQIYDGPRMVHGARSMFSTSEYRTYRDATQTLSGILAYARPWTLTLGGGSQAEVSGTLVSCNYFEVLRQQPTLGSGFTPGNCDDQGAEPVVVLGHDLWLTTFGADPALVGRSVVLNGHIFSVVGVAPEGFQGVDLAKTELFVTIAAHPLLRPEEALTTGAVSFSYNDEKLSWLSLIGRRNQDASVAHVRAELAVTAAQIDAEQSRTTPTRLVVERASAMSFPEARPVLLGVGGVVLTAFGFVLLIACVNVANLLLARAAGRTREIAVRLSLGASRGRLVRQLLTESVLISVAGGVLGSVLALWALQSLFVFVLSAVPGGVPPFRFDPSPDARVFWFAVALTFGTGILFGLVPALHASSPDVNTALKQDVSGSADRRGTWLQGALVGAQVAVCMVLMIASGLLLRGLQAAQTAEPGFEYRGVAVASFDLRGLGYDAQKATLFQRQLMERVRSLPGVEGVAQVAMTPLTPGSRGTMFRIPGQDQWQQVDMNDVSPEYFALIGVPLVSGRTFTAAEVHDTSTAAIITEATARRYWPGQDPIGKTLEFSIGPNRTVTREVVGVTRDANITSIAEVPTSYVYFPSAPRTQLGLRLLVKSRADFASTTAGIRAVARALEPGLFVGVAPLEDNLRFWQQLSRFVTVLAGSLAALALVLAAIGIYGVVAYGMSRRVREIGIRLALGAGTVIVLGLMLRRAMRPVVIGAVVGVVLSAAASRILSGVLFGVSPLDPLGLGLATLVVLAVALTAGFLPARRATRVDPMTTLRYE